MLRIVLILSIALLAIKVSGNDTISRAYIDSKTYEYYLAQQWDELIKLGKLANKHDIDFFYLQLRMGTAYYYKKNYLSAVKYFERSLEATPGYEYAQKMLYYCYLFTNQPYKLKHLMGSMSSELVMQVKSEIKPTFNSISINSGILPKIPYTKDFPIASGNLLAINAPQLNTQNFQNLSSGFLLGNRAGINLAYTRINVGSSINIISQNTLLTPELKAIQEEAYVNLNLRVAKNTYFDVAFNLIRIQSDLAGSYLSEGVTDEITTWNYDTLMNTIPVHVDVIDSVKSIPYVLADNYSYHEHFKHYVLYGGITHATKHIDLSLGVTYSNIGNEKNLQASIGASYYPFGNLNTYYTIDASYRMSNLDTLGISSGYTVKNMIGQKLTSFLWFEGWFAFGDMQNHISGKGAIINNSVYPIQQKLGATLIFPIRQFTFTLNYQFQTRNGYVQEFWKEPAGTYTGKSSRTYTSSWTISDGGGGGMGPGSGGGSQTITESEYYPDSYEMNLYNPKNKIIKEKFNNHLISGGIQWKF